MANGIRVELSEERLVASPGGAATTRCTVYNTSLIVDDYQLRVEGVDPAWVEYPAKSSQIFPESYETVAVVFRPPRTAAVAAGDIPFRVIATSNDNAAVSADIRGILTIEPFVGFAFESVSPNQSSGETEGTWDFAVSNQGNARLTISLSADDEQAILTCSFAEQTVDLDPGEERTVRLTAHAPSALLGGAPTPFVITATAQILASSPPIAASTEPESHTAVVTFLQTPIAQDQPRLEPQVVELSSQTATTNLILTNRGAVPITFSLSAVDPAGALSFEFVGGPRPQVPPNQSSTITIRITCPDRSKLSPPPTPTQFTVTATPVEPSGAANTVMGQLTTPSPADFRLRLEPAQVEGTGPARVSLLVMNVSPRAATFKITAFSRDAGLQVAVAQPQIQIPANEQVSLPIDLTPQEGLEPGSGGAPKTIEFTVQVAPLDAPDRTNDVTGRYVLTPAAINLRLARQKIESAGETVFDLQIENQGRSEVSVALEASDPAGECTYTFDLPRLRIGPRSTVPVRLTVGPPTEHRPDAKWTFEVLARPISPTGPPVRAEGELIYRAPSISLTINPPERRSRRPRTYQILLSNPTDTPITARLSAVDRSSGLGIVLKQDTVTVPPAGRGTVKVPLKVTPWKRTRGSAAQALTFVVAATPVSPPGDATTADGRMVALPPRPRWIWALLALVLLVAFLFSPLYEQAFYLAGWEEDNPPNNEHHFVDDVECAWDQIRDGEPGSIRRACFEQIPRTPESQGRTNTQPTTVYLTGFTLTASAEQRFWPRSL